MTDDRTEILYPSSLPPAPQAAAPKESPYDVAAGVIGGILIVAGLVASVITDNPLWWCASFVLAIPVAIGCAIVKQLRKSR